MTVRANFWRAVGIAGVMFLSSLGGSVSAQSTVADAFPEQAHLIYKGNYTVILTVQREQRKITGEIVLDMIFDKDAVRGRWTATGGLDPNTFTGHRVGTVCDMGDGSDEGESTFYCTPTEFRGKIVNGPNNPQQATMTFNTIIFEDVGKREQAEALAAEERKKAQAAEAIRQKEQAAKDEAERKAEQERQDRIFDSLPPVKAKSKKKPN